MSISPDLRATFERDPDILIAEEFAQKSGIGVVHALAMIKLGRELERKSPEFPIKK